MHTRSAILRRRHRRAGSAAVAAVAIIVLVGFLGITLVGGTRTTGADLVNRIQEAQGYYIADAGIEWSLEQEVGTPVPMSFGPGTFEVTQDASEWVSLSEVGRARRQVRCEPEPDGLIISEGFDYVAGSRMSIFGQFVRFLIMNNTDEDITFDRIKVTWSGSTAYFEILYMYMLGGGSEIGLWSWGLNGWQRFGSGETHEFNLTGSFTLEPHRTAAVWLDLFRENQGIPGGGFVNMTNVEFHIEFINGSTTVGEVHAGQRPTS